MAAAARGPPSPARAEAQAPKGSLYFHFPGGKEQLAAETVKRAADAWAAAIEAVLAESGDVAAVAHGIAGLLGATLEESRFRDGCPLATVGLEVAGHDGEVRSACADGYRHWLDLIAVRLRDWGAADPEDLAAFVLASIEGALLLAKVQHDTGHLHRVAGRLAALVASEITAA